MRFAHIFRHPGLPLPHISTRHRSLWPSSRNLPQFRSANGMDRRDRCLGGSVPRTRKTVVVSMTRFDAGPSRPSDGTSNFTKMPFRIHVRNQKFKDPYQIGAVSSFGENRRRERNLAENAGTAVNSFSPGAARTLGFSGRRWAAREFCEM